MHEKGLGFKAGYTLFDHYSETPLNLDTLKKQISHYC